MCCVPDPGPESREAGPSYEWVLRPSHPGADDESVGIEACLGMHLTPSFWLSDQPQIVKFLSSLNGVGEPVEPGQGCVDAYYQGLRMLERGVCEW